MSTKSLNNVHIAQLTKDDKTGATYSTPESVIGVQTADIKRNGNNVELPGDDGIISVANGKGVTQLTIAVTSLTLEQRAALLGHTIEKGVMTIKAGDQPPYFAWMFEGYDHNDKKIYVKLLKGKAQEIDTSMETLKSTPVFHTPSIVVNFVDREYDGFCEKICYESSTTYDTSVGAAWYTTVEPATTP